MTLPFCCSSLSWKRGYGWILSFPSYFLPVQWECYLSAAGGEGNVLNWLVLSLDGLVLPEPGKCLKLTYFPWACLWILPRLPFSAVSCSPHLGDGEDLQLSSAFITASGVWCYLQLLSTETWSYSLVNLTSALSSTWSTSRTLETHMHLLPQHILKGRLIPEHQSTEKSTRLLLARWISQVGVRQ